MTPTVPIAPSCITLRLSLRWLVATWLVWTYCGVPAAHAQHLTKDWVRSMATPLVENKIVDGISIGYIQSDNWGIVHLGNSGLAQQKPDDDTIYEIGSITKVFTNLLLADAVVHGLVDLEAHANIDNLAHIELPKRNDRPIRWIDLSIHRSGLPRLPDNLAINDLTNPYRRYDSKKLAEFLQDYQLPRDPGESQEYSNLGGSLLGYLISQKSKKSYQDLLRKRIAEPLGMKDCTVSLSEEQSLRSAQPHDRFGSPTPPWTFADLPGAGGIHASLRDMMRFARAQLNPPDGSPGDAIELAWKKQHDADTSGPAMAMGWMIDQRNTRWHNGQTGGSHSILLVNRNLDCAVIVLCNTAVINEIDALAGQILMKATGAEVKLLADQTKDERAKTFDTSEIDATHRQRLVGRYQLTPDFIFDVRDEDGHLMVGITNQPTQEVFPDSLTHWSYRSVAATLEFKLPNRGSAKRLILHQNGIKQTARRIK